MRSTPSLRNCSQPTPLPDLFHFPIGKFLTCSVFIVSSVSGNSLRGNTRLYLAANHPVSRLIPLFTFQVPQKYTRQFLAITCRLRNAATLCRFPQTDTLHHRLRWFFVVS